MLKNAAPMELLLRRAATATRHVQPYEEYQLNETCDSDCSWAPPGGIIRTMLSFGNDSNDPRRLEHGANAVVDFVRSVRRSGFLLVAANLVPLFGVLFLDWDLFLVLTLFWAENVVIGAFGILKVAFASSDGIGRRLSSALFFSVHYGAFMFGHATLLIALFGDSATAEGSIETVEDLLHYLLRGDVGLAVLALTISHGWSFVSNFHGAAEYERLSGSDAMTLPYRRVFITQAGLILGAAAIERFGTPLAGLVMLVAIKILFDLHFHRREHERLAPRPKNSADQRARNEPS
jgi:hypothetical protein